MGLKVIQLLASHKWTGPAEGVVTLTRDLRTRGHEVRFFCTPHTRRLLAEQAEKRGVSPQTSLRLDGKRILGALGDVRQLRRILQEIRPDILHVHLSTDHVIGALALRKTELQTRLVRTIHHPKTLEPRIFRAKLYGSHTAGFITLCGDDAARLRKVYDISPERIAVIYGAVDIKRFSSNLEARLGRAEFGLKMTSPVIGMVARFQSNRRHELVLSIVARLLKSHPTLKLLLVGRGEYQPEIEGLVRQKGLSPNVILTGYRDADLPQIYAAMDVLVYPVSGSDGSCRAALEAMAVGRPVVGFRTGALAETLVDGKTGRLIADGDEKGLESALDELLYDRALSRRMGEEARRRVESAFTEARRAEETEKYYQSLIRSGN